MDVLLLCAQSQVPCGDGSMVVIMNCAPRSRDIKLVFSGLSSAYTDHLSRGVLEFDD